MFIAQINCPDFRLLSEFRKRHGVFFQDCFNSTLSDYMITIFQDRHSGMDCRNPGSMDGLELTIHGT
jgi:hypothetical protein